MQYLNARRRHHLNEVGRPTDVEGAYAHSGKSCPLPQQVNVSAFYVVANLTDSCLRKKKDPGCAQVYPVGGNSDRACCKNKDNVGNSTPQTKNTITSLRPVSPGLAACRGLRRPLYKFLVSICCLMAEELVVCWRWLLGGS